MKRLVGVAVGALLFAGCSHDTGDLDAPDSPVARSNWSGGAGEAALLEGTLELRAGCLLIKPSYDPYLPTVAVFPRIYTTWDEASKTLTYAGVEYQMGDAVSAGGGGTSNIPAEGFPAACIPFVTQNNGLFYIQDTDLEPYLQEGD